MTWFNEKYDKQIRAAYSRLLGVKWIPDWSWEIQKLPPRLGGVMLRTGKCLSATKYSQSLAISALNMEQFTEMWDPNEVFKTNA